VAESTSSPSTTTPPAASNAPAPRAGAPDGVPGPGGHGGPGGRGFGKGGPGGAIHGEFVTRNGSNGFRTIDTQLGQVTSVSQDAITVKSEDGFTKTYTVDQNTVVNSGRDGIGNVKNGDTVRVNAVVESGKAHAMDIHDETTLGSIGQHWAPPGQATPSAPA
jgi:hypothetical protein